jgi:hypothetical protein
MARAGRTFLFKSDAVRWRRVAAETASWDERNKLIAQLIPSGSAVLDLGSGACTLRTHLKTGCQYQASDLAPFSADVLPCDFNRGIYPSLPRRFDYIVCSGLLEYLRDPLTFLKTVRSFGDCLLLSYAPHNPGDSRLRRQLQGWVNSLTQAQLEQRFDVARFRWRVVGRWRDQLIYELVPSLPATEPRSCQ